MARETKPDNLIDTILSTVKLLLMIVGIVGLAFEFFKDDGLLQMALGKIFDSATNMVITVVLLGALYYFNHWITASDGNASKKGDLPMYAMLLAGLYYSYRFISTGGF